MLLDLYPTETEVMPQYKQMVVKSYFVIGSNENIGVLNCLALSKQCRTTFFIETVNASKNIMVQVLEYNTIKLKITIC